MIDFEAEQCTNVCIKLIIVEVYRIILIWQVENLLAGKKHVKHHTISIFG